MLVTASTTISFNRLAFISCCTSSHGTLMAHFSMAFEDNSGTVRVHGHCNGVQNWPLSRSAFPRLAILDTASKLSGRALARAPLGGGFIRSRPFGRGWVRSSTIGHVSSRPPKIPYIGFAHSTAPSIRHLAVRYGAFRSNVEVKADPAMPPIGYCVCSALRRCHTPVDSPPLCANPPAAPSPPEP